MVSILIFSSALIALTAIAGKGIAATQDVSAETTAHYLAQEGLEVVRNIRDTNFIAGANVPWDSGFGSGSIVCLKTSPCQVDYGTGGSAPTLITPCLVTGCPVEEDATDDTFKNGGTPSGFSREVYVSQATPYQPYEYLVTSVVTWNQKTVPRSVTLQTVLTEWQQ